MKSKLLGTAFLLAGLSGSALAASGDVSFTGKITGTTCKVDASSKNIAVQMGSWSTTDFTGVNTKSVPTKFAIKLYDCPAPGTGFDGARVRFDGIRQWNNGAPTGYLAINTGAGTATGVAIALSLEKLGEAPKFIPMNESSDKVVPIAGTTDIVIPLSASYIQYSGAAVTAGSANATAQYGIDYS